MSNKHIYQSNYLLIKNKTTMLRKKIPAFMIALTITAGALANPLLKPYKTPHETVPFNEIKIEHFMPAFEEAMKVHKAEIDAIIDNPKAPTFENTIVALDKSGKLMSKVSAPFSGGGGSHGGYPGRGTELSGGSGKGRSPETDGKHMSM